MDDAVWENLALSLIEQAEAKAFSDKDLAAGLAVVLEVLQTRMDEATSDAIRSADEDDSDEGETKVEDEESGDVPELDFD